MIAWGLLFLVALFCTWSLRRRRSSKKCLFSLLLLLVTVPESGIFALVTKGERPGGMQMELGIAMLLIVLGSVWLAITGLRRFRRRGSRYGRKRAMLTLALAPFLVGFYVWGMTHAGQAPVPGLLKTTAKPAATSGTNAAPDLASDSVSDAAFYAELAARAKSDAAYQPFVSEELNYRYTPRPPWKKMNVAQNKHSISFGIMREDIPLYFILIAEKVKDDSPRTTAELLGVSKNYIKQKAQKTNFLREQPMKLHGLEGIRFETEALVGDSSSYYVFWVSLSNGVLYQLITAGDITHKELVIKESPGLLEQFEILHPDKGGTKSKN